MRLHRRGEERWEGSLGSYTKEKAREQGGRQREKLGKGEKGGEGFCYRTQQLASAGNDRHKLAKM